jgi:hypothetical protein
VVPPSQAEPTSSAVRFDIADVYTTAALALALPATCKEPERPPKTKQKNKKQPPKKTGKKQPTDFPSSFFLAG